MGSPGFNFTTHLSIVWGVTLAILTLIEWRSLDRDPMRKQILSPFIEREITARLNESGAAGDIVFEDPLEARSVAGHTPEANVQYVVEFGFDGVLFLVYFFVPVLAFHGAGWLVNVLRSGAGRSGG